MNFMKYIVREIFLDIFSQFIAIRAPCESFDIKYVYRIHSAYGNEFSNRLTSHFMLLEKNQLPKTNANFCISIQSHVRCVEFYA